MQPTAQPPTTATPKITPITIKIILTTRPIPPSPSFVVRDVWVGAGLERVENRSEDLVVDWIDDGSDEPVDVTLAFVPIKTAIPSQSFQINVCGHLT
jgi:hypothetical protein